MSTMLTKPKQICKVVKIDMISKVDKVDTVDKVDKDHLNPENCTRSTRITFEVDTDSHKVDKVNNLGRQGS